MGKSAPLTREDLEQTAALFRETGGNISEMERILGKVRSTIRKRILKAEKAGILPVGSLKIKIKSGDTRVYILTSAQDSTPVFLPFWENLQAYAKHRNAEIMVSGYTYAKHLFEDNRVDRSVYAGEVGPYMSNDRIDLCDGLVWLGNVNILPTSPTPCNGWETITGDSWAVIPHARVQLTSIPTMFDQPAKHIMSTGAVTVENYVQRAAGQKAEFHHTYGATIVEIDPNGFFWCRQLLAEKDGSFYDLKTRVAGGVVKTGLASTVEAITWGDIHRAQADADVFKAHWGFDIETDKTVSKGIIDHLKPKYQMMHDLLDFRARNHHNRNDPHFRAEALQKGFDSVEDELKQATRFLIETNREFCQTVVVQSNHDAAYVKWLKDPKGASDAENAAIWHYGNYLMHTDIRDGGNGSTAFPDTLRRYGDLSDINFLNDGESFRICQTTPTPIDMNLHGDKGPNGSRGSARALSKVATKLVIDHSHSACIFQGVYQGGMSGKLDQGYNRGSPSSWSHSDVVTYANAKSAILTMAGGKYYAEQPIYAS